MNVPVAHQPATTDRPASRPLRTLRANLGPLLGVAIGLGLMVAGVTIAWTSPLLSSGHLFAGPWVMLAGAAIVFRVAFIRGWLASDRRHY